MRQLALAYNSMMAALTRPSGPAKAAARRTPLQTLPALCCIMASPRSLPAALPFLQRLASLLSEVPGGSQAYAQLRQAYRDYAAAVPFQDSGQLRHTKKEGRSFAWCGGAESPMFGGCTCCSIRSIRLTRLKAL